MIVDHLADDDRSVLVQVDSAVILSGNRLVVRSENEPVGMNEIDGVLPFSPAMKGVTPLRRRRRQVRQRPGVA